MEQNQNYGERPAEASEFHLSIPEGPVRRPRGGFTELRSGGGFHSFQQYAEHCLTDQGGEPTLDAFRAKFTTWSLEGAGGVVLYPEGSAFKVLARHFMEGDEPVTYHADAAHYVAVMLCLHPTVFPSTGSTIPPPDEEAASYQITASWEPDGPVEFKLVPKKPIEATGEIFMWKFLYEDQKVSFTIKIFPSPAGRNNIFLGGRLGTLLAESI